MARRAAEQSVAQSAQTASERRAPPPTPKKKQRWGIHTRYITGEHKTISRGWVHGVEAACLAVWITTSAHKRPALLRFLSGKFLSCAASGVLHLRPHETLEAYALWDTLDWICISLSALSGCILWLPPDWTRPAAFAVFAVAPFIGGFTWCQAMAYGRKDWPREKRCRAIQSALQVCVLAGCAVAQGLACFPQRAYACQVAVYAVGLLSWVLQDDVPLAWHSPRRWSGHEDFHLCVLVGDLLNLHLLARHGKI